MIEARGSKGGKVILTEKRETTGSTVSPPRGGGSGTVCRVHGGFFADEDVCELPVSCSPGFKDFGGAASPRTVLMASSRNLPTMG